MMSNKQVDERLKNVKYVVEANSFEQQMLWESNSKEGIALTKYEGITPLDWKDETYGYGLEIGQLDNRPLYISLRFAIINGKDVVFVYFTSQVCDYKALNIWIKENCPTAWHTDAINFGHVR